jgi:hypothetical protein
MCVGSAVALALRGRDGRGYGAHFAMVDDPDGNTILLSAG